MERKSVVHETEFKAPYCCSLVQIANFPKDWGGGWGNEKGKPVPATVKKCEAQIEAGMLAGYYKGASYLAVVTDGQASAMEALRNKGFKELASFPSIHPEAFGEPDYDLHIFLKTPEKKGKK